MIGHMYPFIVQTDAPQPFPTTVSILDFFQFVIAAIVAQAGPRAVSDVKRMHEYRRSADFCEQDLEV